jgi:hypothetical protein
MQAAFFWIVPSCRRVPNIFEQSGTKTPVYAVSHPKKDNLFGSLSVFENTGCHVLLWRLNES